MKPHCVENGDVDAKQILILDHTRRLVYSLPDGLTCHDVCAEVVKSIPGLTAHKGFFGFPGADHSWLTINEWPDNYIIDPYPIAAASGPILLTTIGIMNPWRLMYRSERSISSIMISHFLMDTDFVNDLYEKSVEKRKDDKLPLDLCLAFSNLAQAAVEVRLRLLQREIKIMEKKG